MMTKIIRTLLIVAFFIFPVVTNAFWGGFKNKAVDFYCTFGEMLTFEWCLKDNVDISEPIVEVEDEVKKINEIKYAREERDAVYEISPPQEKIIGGLTSEELNYRLELFRQSLDIPVQTQIIKEREIVKSSGGRSSESVSEKVQFLLGAQYDQLSERIREINFTSESLDFGDNDLTADIITANTFIGDGSQLTGITSFSTSTTRSVFSSSATGLSYDNSTGIFSLTSGYNIPLTASTTEWSNKVSSQWTTVGSDIYYSTGNVGIGTTTPETSFSVVGDGYFTGGLGVGLVNSSAGTIQSTGNISVSTGPSLTTRGLEYSAAGQYLLLNDANPRLDVGTTFNIAFNSDSNISRMTSGKIGIGTGIQGSSGGTLIAGNIGIGTTTPGSNLAVVGSGQYIFDARSSSYNGHVRVESGGNGTYYDTAGAVLTFTDYSDTSKFRQYVNNSGNFQIEGPTGNDIFTLGSSGYVSVGTSTINSSTARLSVVGLDVVSTRPVFQTGGSDGDYNFTVLQNGNVGVGTTTPGSPLSFSNSTGSKIDFGRPGSTSSGIKLPGTSSFEIYGNGTIYLSAGGESSNTFSFTSSGAQTNGGTTASLSLYSSSDSTGLDFAVRKTSLPTSSYVYSTQGTGSFPFDAWGNLILGPSSGRDVVIGRSNELVIKSGGNVGIGTTTPNAVLDLSGSRHPYTAPILKLTNDQSDSYFAGFFRNGTDVGGIMHYNASSLLSFKVGNSQNISMEADNSGTVTLGVKASGIVNLRTGTGGYISMSPNYIETIRVDSTGMGINNTSPTVPLDVVGMIRSASSTQNVGLEVNYTGSSGRKYQMLSCYDCGSAGLGGLEIYDATASAARAYITAGVNGWQTPSDLRLKTDVETLSVLDKLDQVRGTSFVLKDSGKKQIGVIAQEIKLVFPEAVSGTEDANSFLGVSYDAIAAIALQGVKELSEKVDQLSSSASAAVGDAFGWMRFYDNNLCVDDICISKEEFKDLLRNNGANREFVAPVQEDVVQEGGVEDIVSEIENQEENIITENEPETETEPEPMPEPEIETETQIEGPSVEVVE